MGGNEVTEYTTFRFEKPETGLGLITLSRPGRLNAINLDMLEEMHDLHEKLCLDEETRIIIIRGEGKGFCSGADLADERMLRESPVLWKDAASFLIGVQKKYAQMIIELRRLPQPVISLVQGASAGGGFTIVLASDIVYAAPKAKFIPSFINIGLSGGELGTSYFLPRAVGSARAAEILYTGRAVSAEEAAEIGLVSRVVPEEELMDTALATCRTMLSKSYLGLRLTKEVLNQNATAQSLEAAVELENRNQAICAFTPAFNEAIQAFMTGKK